MTEQPRALLEQTDIVVKTVLGHIRARVQDPQQVRELCNIPRLYRDSVRDGYDLAKRTVVNFTFYLRELVSQGLVGDAAALVQSAERRAAEITAWLENNAECVRSMENLIDKIGAEQGSSDLLAKITIKEVAIETNILGLLAKFVTALILRKDKAAIEQLTTELVSEFEAIDRTTGEIWRDLRSSVEQLAVLARQVSALESPVALQFQRILLRTVTIGQQLLQKYATE